MVFCLCAIFVTHRKMGCYSVVAQRRDSHDKNLRYNQNNNFLSHGHSFLFKGAGMVGRDHFAMTACSTLVANMEPVMSPGLAIAKKVGVVFFATRTSTTALITTHATMEPLVSILAKDLTHANVPPDGPEPTAKSGSPTNVPITCVPMEVLARVLASTIILVFAPWDSMESIANLRLKSVPMNPANSATARTAPPATNAGVIKGTPVSIAM